MFRFVLLSGLAALCAAQTTTEAPVLPDQTVTTTFVGDLATTSAEDQATIIAAVNAQVSAAYRTSDVTTTLSSGSIIATSVVRQPTALLYSAPVVTVDSLGLIGVVTAVDSGRGVGSEMGGKGMGGGKGGGASPYMGGRSGMGGSESGGKGNGGSESGSKGMGGSESGGKGNGGSESGGKGNGGSESGGKGNGGSGYMGKGNGGGGEGGSISGKAGEAGGLNGGYRIGSGDRATGEAGGSGKSMGRGAQLMAEIQSSADDSTHSVAAALAAGMVFVAGVSLISIRRGKKVTYEITEQAPLLDNVNSPAMVHI